MKSKTDEIIEKAFQHAMNFFKSNDRGLDNQSLCLKQLMELTGFDFDTCLKIQNPVLSLLMAIDTMNIGQSVIENNMQMAIQGIRNHLSSLQSSKPQILDLQSVKPQISQQKFEQDFDRVDISYGIMNYTGQSITGETIQQLATLVNIRGTMQPGWGPNVFGNITEIHLANNSLSGLDLSPLYKSLYYQKINLKILDLSFNKLCNNSVGELLDSICNKQDKQPHHIKVLKLNNNLLDDKAAEYFSWHLSSGTLPELKTLDVSGNQITTTGYGHFANALNSEMVKDIVLTLETIDFLTKGGKYYSDQLVQHFKSFQINEIRSNMSVDKWKECKETGVNVGMSGFTGIMKSALGGKFNTASMFTYAVKEILMDNLLKPETLYCYIDVKDFISEVVGEVSDQNCTIF